MGGLRRRAAVARGLVALATVTAIVAAGATPPSRAQPQPQIVFAASDDPAASGEIEALTFGGKQVDLSNSPAEDDSPAVSPDGRTVAFMSVRGGQLAAYTVRIDGTHLRRVSPALGPFVAASIFATRSIAWSPDGRRLAVQVYTFPTGGGVYVVDADGVGWRRVSPSRESVVSAPSWSPDGRSLLYAGGSKAEGAMVRVVPLDGGARWSAHGASGSWSASGRVVVESTKTQLAVYDATGRRLASFAGTWAAWSPNGEELASLTKAGTLTVREGGTGPAKSLGTFDVGLQNQIQGALEWVGNSTVAVSNGFSWKAVDAATTRAVVLPGLFSDNVSALSSDGREASEIVSGPTVTTLEVEALGASRPTVVQRHATCGFGEPYDEIQLVPSAHLLVYDYACTDPPTGLFAIAPDGSGLHRLTPPSVDADQPALSSDGSTLAFVEKAPENCLSCADSIWLAQADGTDPRQLVAGPQKNGASLFDDSPAFSPDGSELVFAQAGSAPGFSLFPSDSALFEVPTAGGQPKALGVAGSSPAWGPKLIVYANGKNQIAVANPDGTGARVLGASGQTLSGVTAWSSDGRLAVLGSSGAAGWIATSGGQSIDLPDLQLDPQNGGLAWSPDGTQLAFVADDSEGVSDLWVVNADGTGLRRLTQDIGASLGVTWR